MSKIKQKGLICYLHQKKDIERIWVLDFLSQLNFSLLWIKPREARLQSDEIYTLLKAFDSFFCVLWYINCGTYSSAKINEIQRVFGKWKGLKKNIFLKKDYFANKTKYYSDLTIITSAEIVEAQSFFSRQMFGLDSTITFCKDINDNFSEFDDLASVWFSNILEIKSMILLDRENKSKIINYYETLLKKECIIVLNVQNTETIPSFILIGKKDTIKQGFTNLYDSNNFDSIDKNLFFRYQERLSSKNLSNYFDLS